MSRSVMVTITIRGSVAGASGRKRRYQSWAASSALSSEPATRRASTPKPTSSEMRSVAARGERARRRRTGVRRLQPVVDQEKGRPEPGVIVARMVEQLHLGAMQGDGPGHRSVLELPVDLGDQPGGHRVVDVPERRQRAARAGLDGEAGKPERRPIVALRGIAGAEGEELEGTVAELEQPDELPQSIHRQLVVEGAQEGRLRVAAELSVRGDVHDGEHLVLELLLDVDE